VLRPSPHRIVDRKKRALALMLHYALRPAFDIHRLSRGLRVTGGRRFGEMKKVLLIRIDGLGDMAMSAPVFSSVRKVFPNARITLLTASWSRGIAEALEGLDEIICFDAPWMVKGRIERKESVLKVIRRLRKERFDLAVDFRGDFRNNILMYLTKAEYRVGFDITGCGYLLTDVVPCDSDHHPTKMCLAAMKYLAPACEIASEHKLKTTEADRGYIHELLARNGVYPAGAPVVVIHPGAKWEGRWWEARRYAEVADRLIEEYGASIVISGAPADVHLAGQIAGLMKNKAAVVAGKTSLRQFLALLDRSCLFIGVDSGPMHMAAAMGTRVVALFGPALAQAVGPYGSGHIVVTKQRLFPCSPCAQTACKMADFNCMKAITTEDVWAAVREQMDAVIPRRRQGA